MAPTKELKLAYVVASIFLIVGVLCYAGYSAKPPDPPLRMVYQTNAGKVLFDHQTHTSAMGYALDCYDCHHHPEDAEESLACGSCHGAPEDHERIAQTCNECHDPEDYDLAEVYKRSDALHEQCIGCHEQYGAGPMACAACHIL